MHLLTRHHQQPFHVFCILNIKDEARRHHAAENDSTAKYVPFNTDFDSLETYWMKSCTAAVLADSPTCSMTYVRYPPTCNFKLLVWCFIFAGVSKFNLLILKIKNMIWKGRILIFCNLLTWPIRIQKVLMSFHPEHAALGERRNFKSHAKIYEQKSSWLMSSRQPYKWIKFFIC